MSNASSALQVLVAEDNLINREVARAMLEHLGCVVSVADDGVEACRLIEERHFDAVFMDCQMPALDGYAATRLVRERETTSGRHVPIIALTANALPEDRALCMASGMDDFVSKPFGKASLQAALDRARSRTAPLAPRAVIDLDALETIRSLQRPGRPRLLDEVVDLYIASTPAELAALGAACAAADWKTTRHRAHKLRGSSRTIGAVRVSDALVMLEEIAGTAEASAIEALLLDLRELHGEAIRELKRLTKGDR